MYEVKYNDRKSRVNYCFNVFIRQEEALQVNHGHISKLLFHKEVV